MSTQGSPDSTDAIQSSENQTGKQGSESQWCSGPVKGLAIGLGGGLITWLILLAVHPVFLIPEDLRSLPTPAPIEDLIRMEAAMTEVKCYNAMVSLSVLGAILGAALAIGEGASRGSISRCLFAAVGCALIAALAGSLGAWLGHLVLQKYVGVEQVTPLARTIRVQLVMLGTLGAGLGLGLGLLLGGRMKTAVSCLFAGTIAGVMAGMVYPVIAAALLPNVRTEVLVPMQIGSYVLWTGLSTGLLGLTIYGIARGRERGQKRRIALTNPSE